MQVASTNYPSWDQHPAPMVARVPPPPPPPPPDQGHNTPHEDVTVSSGWPVGGSKGRKGGESKAAVAQRRTAPGGSNATHTTSSRGKVETGTSGSEYNRDNCLAMCIQSDAHESRFLSATQRDQLRSLQ